MAQLEIAAYNDAWLKAWSEKHVERLLGFYHPDTVYKDAQTPAGLNGHAQLRPYLAGLFAATPPMTYLADETWPIPAGYCGRWICTITIPDGKPRRMRGFDLVMLDGANLITLNEVYTHTLPD